MEIPLSLFDGALIALATAAASFIGTTAANRVMLRYMQRDIARAQATADGAHGRIDSMLGIKGGRRAYDPQDNTLDPGAI